MVFFIILTWNGEKYLSKLFKSLKDLNYPQEKIKFIIIDSNSTDKTIGFLENLKWNNLQIIKLEKNIGFAAGNNMGMRSALENNADYVVLLNQDTFVEPNFLIELIKSAETEKNIGVVQPLILYYDKPEEISSAGNELNYLGYGWCGFNHQLFKNYKLQTASRKITYASGAAVLYKVPILKKIGLFDENYFSYYEDTDICLRAKLSGYGTILAPKAICYHDNRNPVSKNKIRYFWLEKNRVYLLLKFYELKTLLLILPMLILTDLGRLWLAICRGYFWQLAKSKFWFIIHFNKWFSARREIQQNRKIKDKELLKNFVAEIKYQDNNNFLLDKFGNKILKFYWNSIKKFI